MTDRSRITLPGARSQQSDPSGSGDQEEGSERIVHGTPAADTHPVGSGPQEDQAGPDVDPQDEERAQGPESPSTGPESTP
jgi:hypothetical protein